jgi:hypothetical protein
MEEGREAGIEGVLADSTTGSQPWVGEGVGGKKSGCFE